MTFYKCKMLKKVTFAGDSLLETIGSNCFYETGLETLALPKTVREIESNAFKNCKNLRDVTFAPKSRLEKIGQSCFCGTGIEKIVIPRTVKEI